jgi:hypothetical protein
VSSVDGLDYDQAQASSQLADFASEQDARTSDANPSSEQPCGTVAFDINYARHSGRRAQAQSVTLLAAQSVFLT